MKNRWVRVEDRLPEDKKEVFIYDDLYDIYAIGFLNDGDFFYISTGTIGYKKTNGITHWMYPDPPEGE